MMIIERIPRIIKKKKLIEKFWSYVEACEAYDKACYSCQCPWGYPEVDQAHQTMVELAKELPWEAIAGLRKPNHVEAEWCR